MADSTLLGDWTKQYAGSQLDLTGYRLSFEDNFNAMSVGTSWGSGPWYAPVRPTFGGATFVSPDAPTDPFSVANGELTISMEQVDGQWQSGHMQSVNAAGQGFAQQYGYFEMSAKFPAGAGSWPAFWLLSTDSSQQRVEIDVIEAYGENDHNGHHSTVHFTPTADSSLTEKVVNGDYTGLPGSMFDGQFHTYGAKVTPDWITIYYDGKEVSRFPSNDYVATPLYMAIDLALYAPEMGDARGQYDDANLTGLKFAGTAQADTLGSTAHADTMDGGAGADVMAGGSGDDVYYVDNAGDRVVEAAGGGYDVVNSSVSFVTGTQEIEELRLTGTANISATGNAQSNPIFGNTGSNTLDGGAGADTMRGGAGSDTY